MKNISNEFLDHFCTFEMYHYAYLVVWIFVYHFFLKKITLLSKIIPINIGMCYLFFRTSDAPNPISRETGSSLLKPPQSVITVVLNKNESHIWMKPVDNWPGSHR
jgi:hypothetical protein